MYKYLFFMGIVFCTLSLGYFMLGLMQLEPLVITGPLFFLSIFFTVHCYNQKRHSGKTKKG